MSINRLIMEVSNNASYYIIIVYMIIIHTPQNNETIPESMDLIRKITCI